MDCLLTFVDGQIGLLFTQNIVLLFLLHVCPFVIWLIEYELVGACAASESIPSARVVVAGGGARNSEAIAAVRADWW